MTKRKTRLWRRPKQLNPGLRLAVEASGGSMASLASRLKITPQAVAQWDVIPLDRVLDIERITKVDRERLRPDLYRRR
jgi:DNA-binding transcriptional regulator YdaS (Cro superfamily)